MIRTSQVSPVTPTLRPVSRYDRIEGSTPGEGDIVPKFLVEAKYSAAGIRGLHSEGGSARLAATRALVESLGGTVECFYFAFGDTDAFIIVDLPDNATVAAVQMAVNGTGTISSRTVVLLTPSEMDDAAKRDVPFHPPAT